ncbi:MAG: c-type cytochrome [Pseudomonadota bacterium]
MPPPGDAAKGSAVYTTQACNTCHAADGKGDLGPNITMSVTAGLGSWTYQQFLNAVRFGKDKDNVQLCVAMFQFSATDINDASMADLYAFLKSQPISDVVNKGSYCP